MIKAIIFDCFGVLVTESWLAFKKKYFGQNSDDFAEATEIMDKADSGIISHGEFLKQIAKMSGMSVDGVENELNTNRSNDELFKYIAHDLKPKYKIGMLSNAASNWLNNFFTDEQLKLFDTINLSYQTGIIKPDPKAFRVIAEELGVELYEAAFVDDQERHLNAAKAIGMQAILYKDFAQFKRELEQILAG